MVDAVQWFLFTYLGKRWSKDGTRFTTPELSLWAEKVFAKEGVLCFDVNASKEGAINPDDMAQVRAVSETLKRLRRGK